MTESALQNSVGKYYPDVNKEPTPMHEIYSICVNTVYDFYNDKYFKLSKLRGFENAHEEIKSQFKIFSLDY